MKAWRPNSKSSKVLVSAQSILNEYQYPITFRQLYYRLVDVGAITNEKSSYRMLNNLITNARKYGRLHPSLFVPSSPVLAKDYDGHAYLEKCIDLYHVDRTKTQQNYVEVWVERNNVYNFVEHLLRPYDIPVFVSQESSNYAFAYQAYQRLRAAAERGKIPRVIRLSDFCVSSHNSFEYFLTEIASLFDVSYAEISNVIFSLGILPDHIVRYDLVEAPSTTKELRTKGFDDKYGDLLESIGHSRSPRVEIEALEPKIFRDLLLNTVFGILDYSQMLEVEKQEKREKANLRALISTNG